MKRIVYFVMLTIILLCSCVACKTLPNTYQFENKDEKIVSVELMHNPKAPKGYTGQTFELIRELEQHEIEPFMESIYALETHLTLTPPAGDFGPNIACVTYENGSKEYFASWHIESVEKGEKLTGVGGYSFRGDCFDELFREYPK